MERNELVVAIILVLVSLILGFAVFSFFFHPMTGEIRSRFKGGPERLRRWLKANGKRIVIILVLAAAGLILLFVGVRFGGILVGKVKSLGSSRTEIYVHPAKAPDADAEPSTPSPESSLNESSFPETSPPEVVSPEGLSSERKFLGSYRKAGDGADILPSKQVPLKSPQPETDIPEAEGNNTAP